MRDRNPPAVPLPFPALRQGARLRVIGRTRLRLLHTKPYGSPSGSGVIFNRRASALHHPAAL